MGILRIKPIHQQLACSINELQGKRINLYIDAMINLFAGVTAGNVALDNCSAIISNIAIDGIDKIIKKIKRMTNVNKIIIYFDGKRPASKNTTSESRRNNMKLPYQDYKNTKNQLIEACNVFVENYDAQIESLDIGEAEVEMFLNRNPKIPSVFVTRDTDMISLCYNYQKKHENDLVYWVSQNDLVKFDEKRSMNFSCISKIVTYLFGNDYCTTLLTPSCAVKLFHYLLQDHINCKYLKDSIAVLHKIEADLLQLISKDNVSQDLIIHINLAISHLCKILIHLYAHHDYKLFFYKNCDKREVLTDGGILDECTNYSKGVAWNLNYHYFGNQFLLYDVYFYKKLEFSDNFKILSKFVSNDTTLNSAKDFKSYGQKHLSCTSPVSVLKLNKNVMNLEIKNKSPILHDISNYINYAKCKKILTNDQLNILNNLISQNTKIKAFYVLNEFKYDDYEIHLPISDKTNNTMFKFANNFVFKDLLKNSKEIKFKE